MRVICGIPDVPLSGPKEFGIRVYRGADRPLGARFTSQSKKRHAL